MAFLQNGDPTCVSDGVKTDETCRFETTEPRNSTDHRSGLSLSVARGNSYQVWWAPDAFGLIRKKEETPELIQKENRSEDPAKPRILNRQLSMDSGTLLRSPRPKVTTKVTTCLPTSGDAHRGRGGLESMADVPVDVCSSLCGPSHFNPRNYWVHPLGGRGATGCLTVPGDPSMQPVPALTTPSF